MPSYSLPSLGRPTQSGGFASGIDDAAYPNLWEGLAGAWSPELGWSSRLIDYSGNECHGDQVGALTPILSPKYAPLGPQTDNFNGDSYWRIASPFDGKRASKSLLDAYLSITSKTSAGSICRGGAFVAWFNIDTSPTGYRVLVGLDSDSSATTNGALLRFSNTGVSFYLAGAGGTAKNVLFNVTWVVGKTYCLVGNVVNNNIQLWLDGELLVEEAQNNHAAGTGDLSNLNVSVGAWKYGDSTVANYATGYSIGTTLVYGRALSPSEITTLSSDPLVYLEKDVLTRTSLAVPGVPYSFSGARAVQGAGSNSAVEVKPTPSSYARTKEESAYPNLWEGLTNFQSPNLKPDALKVHDIVGNVTMETTATQDLGVDGGKFGIQSVSAGSTPSQQRVGDAVNFWSTGKFTCAMNFTWGGTNWVSFRNMMWVRDEFGENVALIRSSNSSGVINIRSSDSAGTDVVNLSLPIIQAGENVTVGLAADFPAGVVTVFLYCHSQGYYQFYDTSLGTGLGPAGDINATSTWNGYTTSGNIDATYHGFAAWNRTLGEREILQLCRNFEAPFAPAPSALALPAPVETELRTNQTINHLHTTPTKSGGYAKNVGEASYPELYDALDFAFKPSWSDTGDLTWKCIKTGKELTLSATVGGDEPKLGTSEGRPAWDFFTTSSSSPKAELDGLNYEYDRGLCIWAKQQIQSTSWQTIASLGESSGTHNCAVSIYNGGYPRAIVSDGTAYEVNELVRIYGFYSTAINVRNSSYFELWAGGKFKGANTSTVNMNTYDRLTLGITADSTPFGQYGGYMSTVLVFNRAITPSEIALLENDDLAPLSKNNLIVSVERTAVTPSVPQARILPAPLTVTTKPEPSLHGGYANCEAKAERPDHYPVFASVPEMGNPGANLRDIITGQASTRTGNPTNEHYAYDYGIGNYHQFRLDRPSGNERDFVEGNFSAACWVRLPTGGLSTNGYLFSLCSSTSEIRYVAIYIDANENPVVAHRNSATTTLTDTNTDLTDRKWHLIGLEITPSNEVFTNGEMKLFVDGKYVSNIEISSGHYDPATYPTDQIGVGVLDRPTTDNPFLGLVGACYIWDRTDLDWDWLYSSHTQPMRSAEVPLFFPDPKRVLVPINPVTQLTSGYASATGTNTTATSIEDVPGLQTDVYLKDTGHIVAYLSAAGSCSNVNREGYWAISINGTDSQVLTRFYKTANDIGCAFVTYRTASPLAKGTYTVKARWYTEASTTLTLDRGQLLAVGLVDDDGDQVPSTYDEVANDTTTSGTLEDIDGLSQSLTMSRQDRIFGAMAASVSCSTNSETISIANVIGTDLVATRTRTLGNSNDIANISATGISIYKDPTSYTIKGKHSTTGGTLTGSYNQSTFAMEVSSTKYLPNEYAHIGTGFPVASDTTTSTTLEPIDGLEATVVTGGQAYIVAIFDLSISNSSANTQASLAIEIEGVDSTVILRDTGSAGSLGACAVVFRSETPLPAGPHTVKGLWATDTGTLTTTEAELSVVALETDIILHEIALPVVANLATPTTVSLASESDSALSVTPVKQVVLGLASETDTALAVTITTPVGLSTETDTALAVTSLKTLAIGVALETDSALSITKAISIGLSSETDTGLALTSLKVKAIGLSSETDTALNVSPGEQHVVGLSTETDSALTLSSTKVKSVGIATETDSGLSITAGVIVSVGIATETDTGLSVDPLEQHVVGISTETDSALSTIPLRTISAGIALETDTALTITHSLGVNVGTALETDSGLSLSSTKIKSIGLATETDSALTVSSGLQQTLSVASETDTALSLSSTKVKGIGLATESDSALATTAEKSKQVGISSETDSALSTTTVKTIAVGITTETDSALSVSPVQSISVGIATETDTALGISKTKLKALGLATETDSGLGTSPLLGTKVINVGLSTETDSGLSISFTSRVAIGVATEANSARSVTQPVVEIKETLFVTKTFRTWLRR